MDPSVGGGSRGRFDPGAEVSPSGFLASLPEAARGGLLSGAVLINVPAGALVYRDGEQPRIFVVIRGLLRVFLSSTEGRQVTVRYVRSGDVAGLAVVVGGPGPMSIQAVTSALVAALRVDQLRFLLRTDPGVAKACAEELARQLYGVIDDLSDQAFLSVRQRLAVHLLNLAVSGDGPMPIVRASHEELAEAIGSIREVVTRNLRRLRRDGLVVPVRGGIGLVDPVRLAQETDPRRGPESQRPALRRWSSAKAEGRDSSA